MKLINCCGVIVGVAGLMAGSTSTLIAGMPSGGPSAPTLEGGPTYTNGGGPIKSGASSNGPSGAPSGVAGSVPGGSNYGGSNDTATSGTRERGVAGSGLPREKISQVDTKSLPSTKTDGKFDTSLLGSDLKSVKEVKATGSTTQQETTTKSQTSTANSAASSKPVEKSAVSADSAKTADKH